MSAVPDGSASLDPLRLLPTRSAPILQIGCRRVAWKRTTATRGAGCRMHAPTHPTDMGVPTVGERTFFLVPFQAHLPRVANATPWRQRWWGWNLPRSPLHILYPGFQGGLRKHPLITVPRFVSGGQTRFTPHGVSGGTSKTSGV